MNYLIFLSLASFFTTTLISEVLFPLLASNPQVEHALECTLALEMFAIICSLCSSLVFKTAQHLHIISAPEEESTQTAEDCNDISLSVIQQSALQLQAKTKEGDSARTETVTVITDNDTHKSATSTETLPVLVALPHSFADCFKDSDDPSKYSIEYIECEELPPDDFDDFDDCEDFDSEFLCSYDELGLDVQTASTLPHSFADCFADCNDSSKYSIEFIQSEDIFSEPEYESDIEEDVDSAEPETAHTNVALPARMTDIKLLLSALPHSFADCFKECDDPSKYGIEFILREELPDDSYDSEDDSSPLDADERDDQITDIIERIPFHETLKRFIEEEQVGWLEAENRNLLSSLPHSFADCFKDCDNSSKYVVEFSECEELPAEDCNDFEDHDSGDDHTSLDAVYVLIQATSMINSLPHSFADCFADCNDSSKYSIEIVQGENEKIEDTEEYDDNYDDDDNNYDDNNDIDIDIDIDEYDDDNEYSNYLNERNDQITDIIEQVTFHETLKSFIDEEQVGWLEAENQKMIQFDAAIKQVKPGILTEDYNIRRNLEVLCCNELLNFDSDSEEQGLCYDREELTGYDDSYSYTSKYFNALSNRVLSETREYAQIGEGIGANTMHFCDKNHPIVQDIYYMNRASNFFYLDIYKAIDESIRRKIEERSLPQLKRWCDLYGTN